MKRSKKNKAVAHRAEAGAAESRAFLEALVPLMVEAGHSPKRLVAEFREICGRMKEPVREWDPTDLAYVADLPHVLSHWYTDEHYTDAQGAPRRLPLRGPGPSLTELIERVGRVGDKLAKEYLRVGVQRMDNELQELAYFSLELLFRHGLSLLP